MYSIASMYDKKNTYHYILYVQHCQYLYLFGTAKGGMETAFSGRVSLM